MRGSHIDLVIPIMNKHQKQPLDELLKSYAERPIPPLPGSFSQNVLREIRLQKTAQQKSAGWTAEIYQWLFRPQLLAASAMIAICVGVIAPSMISSTSSSLAATGLGLQVFSSAEINIIF